VTDVHFVSPETQGTSPPFQCATIGYPVTPQPGACCATGSRKPQDLVAQLQDAPGELESGPSGQKKAQANPSQPTACRRLVCAFHFHRKFRILRGAMKQPFLAHWRWGSRPWKAPSSPPRILPCLFQVPLGRLPLLPVEVLKKHPRLMVPI